MLTGKVFRKRSTVSGWTAVLLFLVAGIGFSAQSDGVGGVRPTPLSMDFYGHIDGASIGDRLTVLDPDGTLCGEFVVKKPGQYGFLHVYGDDLTTDVDEGATSGDELRFELNGNPLKPLPDEEIRWTGDGERRQVDFAP